jgi:hypothetical protein
MIDTLLARLMEARTRFHRVVPRCRRVRVGVRQILAGRTAFAHHPVGGQDSLSIRLIVGAHRGR